MTDPRTLPDNLDRRRRRARYRAEHRGTKELDLILGPFAVAHLSGFDEIQLAEFEDLLNQEETDLQSILVGLAPVPTGPLQALMERIRAFQIQRASSGVQAR